MLPSWSPSWILKPFSLLKFLIVCLVDLLFDYSMWIKWEELSLFIMLTNALVYLEFNTVHLIGHSCNQYLTWLSCNMRYLTCFSRFRYFLIDDKRGVRIALKLIINDSITEAILKLLCLCIKNHFSSLSVDFIVSERYWKGRKL
jgi:hypothetical protein